MKVNIRADSVEIEGYVNAIERDSKPLWSRMGQFIERICKGAFKKALQRNNDVKLLLNHNPGRELGSTKQGNLELNEDNIGLHARATITDQEVIEKAKRGELVGWSFGFYDRSVIKRVIDGMLHRNVEDLDLDEVSILDNTKTPAYDGTLIMARDANGEMQFRSEPFIDEVTTTEETPAEEKREEETQPKQQEIVENNIDYSKYRKIIDEMKED